MLTTRICKDRSHSFLLQVLDLVVAAGAIGLATLFLSLFQPANAQPALEADELIVHPEPKDPDFFRSRRDGWFWLNDPLVAKREKEKAQKETAIVPPLESSRSAELKAHADLARAVDEALKVAYINPTEENLKRLPSAVATDRSEGFCI